ncbi:polyprenyl synthetase family protein [Alphaproteobacteria bacterium]|nr:polyprenyl synthetase family protein [Alphaproteobacteria bacterium]
MSLNILINKHKKEFDLFYKDLLKSNLSKDQLSKAMTYGSINGGKRIRPFLVNIFSNLYNIKKKQFLRISAAIESIHSYSLIHDDLPCMDNDDFRRGKPSTHKKFNEAIAILAGDALHDLAFEIISDKKTHNNAKVRIILIKKLSIYLGFKGLAGGQSLDLKYEKKKVNISKILQMYEMKTGALFSFCCAAPLILANQNYKEIYFAEEFGKLFGVLFQITDDILDEEKDFKLLGKTPGKDKKQGKSTLLSIIKKQKLKDFCENEIKTFKNKNNKFFKKKPILEKLINYSINRLN